MKVPLLLPTVCLILGIVAAPLVTVYWPLLLAFAVCVLLTIALYRWETCQSLGILVCCFLFGMLIGQRQDLPSKMGWEEAVVFSEPTEKPKTVEVMLLLPDVDCQVRCYLWKDERSRQVHLGSSLLLKDATDGFVRSSDWRFGGDGIDKLSKLERTRLWFLIYRHRLLGRYRSLQMDDEQYAVLAAMTLGDKSALTKELRETYSVTGASHILALSGLHLGIIYFLLYRLTLGRRRFLLSQVIIILSLWAFAFLTGLSVSVVRSATMISIYALFAVGGRHRSSVNLLCFADIVILLLNPSSLYDIGFQLSFAAVLSILLLMPLMEASFPENYFLSHRIQRWIFNLLGVSLAAQIGVAPLIAYHFGRFSTYFLLTNLIVIPAATIILYGALLTLIFPPLGSALLWVVETLNKALGWVSQLPCSSIDGLHPSVLQVCLVYLSFFCLYLAARRLMRVAPVT